MQLIKATSTTQLHLYGRKEKKPFDTSLAKLQFVCLYMYLSVWSIHPGLGLFDNNKIKQCQHY